MPHAFPYHILTPVKVSFGKSVWLGIAKEIGKDRSKMLCSTLDIILQRIILLKIGGAVCVCGVSGEG